MIVALIKSLFGRRAPPPTAGPAPSPEALGPRQSWSDEALMLGYAKGDLGCFEVLFARHQRPLFHFLVRSCQRQDVAEELLQEVMVRIIKGAPTYKPSARFTTWLYTIARHVSIDHARKRRPAKEISLSEPASGGDPDGPLLEERLADPNAPQASTEEERKLFRERLERALQALPAEQREVFEMREIAGLRFPEIAEILDCPLPTVKSRMRYALETLRMHLDDWKDHHFDEGGPSWMTG